VIRVTTTLTTPQAALVLPNHQQTTSKQSERGADGTTLIDGNNMMIKIIITIIWHRHTYTIMFINNINIDDKNENVVVLGMDLGA